MAARRNTPKDGEFISAEEREALDSAIRDAEEQDAQEEQRHFMIPGADNPNNSAWLTYCAEANSEMKLSVSRIPKFGKKESVVLRCQAGDYEPDELESYVQEECGAGDYRIRGYINGGTVFNRTFSCEEMPGKKELQPVQPAQNFDLQNMQMQAMANMMTMQMQMFAGFGDMMKGMVETMRQPHQPQRDPIELLTLAKTLFAPSENVNPMEWLTKGLELAGKVTNGDRETNTMDVLKDLLSTAGPLVTEALKNRSAPRPPQPVPMANPAQVRQFVQPVDSPLPQPAVLTPPNPIEISKKDQLFNALAQMIQNGQTPEMAVDLIQGHINDDEFDEILTHFENPLWISELIASDSRFSGKSVWLERAKAQFLSYLDASDEQADTGIEIANGVLFDDGNQNPPQ